MGRVKHEKSLGVKFPEIAKEWAHDLNGDVTPFDVLPYSNDSFFWRCTKDTSHVWKASVKSRSVNGPGCRFCREEEYASRSKRKSRKERLLTSNLLFLFPEIAEEWDADKNTDLPDQVFAASGKKYYWKCKVCGHSWDARVSNRTEKNSGCPNCYALKSKLIRTNPEVVALWHPIKNKSISIDEVSVSDDRSAFWLCPKCGKSYTRKISLMVKDTFCPHCESRKKPPLDYNKSLAYHFPDVAKQLHPDRNPKDISADQIRPMSGQKLWWKCTEDPDHLPWEAIVHNRTAGGQGCPACARKKRLQKGKKK